jgi:hypothetical protein
MTSVFQDITHWTMGWFYGFKLHLVSNLKGRIIDKKLTTANVYDTKPALELSKN